MLLDVWLYNGKFLPLGTEKTGVSVSNYMPLLLGIKTKRENRGSDSKAEAWRKRIEQGILGDRGKGSEQETRGPGRGTGPPRQEPSSRQGRWWFWEAFSTAHPRSAQPWTEAWTHIPYPLTGSVPPTGTGAWSRHCVPLFLFNAVLPILEQGLFM